MLGLKTVNKDDKTLRQILNDNFKAIDKELSEIRRAIGILASVHAQGDVIMDQLKLQIAGLSESLQDLEGRVVALEKHANFAQWIIRQVLFLGAVGVVVWVVISYSQGG